MKFRNLFLLCFLALFSACSDNVSSADDEESFDASAVCPENLRGTFTDERDGQVYKYTTIGSKVWMAENLNYDDGSVCAYKDCSSKGRIYGMQNALTACPVGWHLPSRDEWLKLFNDDDGYVALLWTSSRGTGNDYTMDGVFFETQTLEARTMTYYDSWDYLSVRCVRD